MELNPILIVDNDQDDLDLIKEVATYLKIERPIYYFQTGNELEAFLTSSTSSPFLIICDVNLSGTNGFEVKKKITGNATLKYKSVPFIYWSTDASEAQIQFAYDLPAQGFFFKPSRFEELCTTFQTILAYWQQSKHPKRVQ